MLIIDDEEDQAYGCIENLENDDDDFFAGGGESQRKRRRHAAVLDDDFCPSTVQILPETVEYHCSVCSHAYDDERREPAVDAAPLLPRARRASSTLDRHLLPTNQITHPPPAEADDGAAPRDGARSPPRPLRPAAAAADDGRGASEPPRSAAAAATTRRPCPTPRARRLELSATRGAAPAAKSAAHAACSNAKFIMLHADCDAAPGTCDVEGKAEAASVLEASGGRPIDYWQSMQGCDGDQCAARNRGKGKDGRCAHRR
ncbi:hypothetical protein JL721_11793 [Aureococcus anophagefferens]|nr:hypothetical protein JL721_11793 [Aureococcus anophagefferens]